MAGRIDVVRPHSRRRRGPAQRSPCGIDPATGSQSPLGNTTRPSTISASTMFMVGEPMKPATKRVAGRRNTSSGVPDLLDQSVAHDDDAVGERHRLDLIVGDVNDGRWHARMQELDLGAHLRAQLGVEIGERLVEQKHLGFAHDGAAHRDALALPARELRGPPFQQIGQDAGSRSPRRRARSISDCGRLAIFSEKPRFSRTLICG